MKSAVAKFWRQTDAFTAYRVECVDDKSIAKTFEVRTFPNTYDIRVLRAGNDVRNQRVILACREAVEAARGIML